MSRDICWYCGGQVVWDSDFNYEDVYCNEVREGIVTYLHCTNCGASIEYSVLYGEDDN